MKIYIVAIILLLVMCGSSFAFDESVDSHSEIEEKIELVLSGYRLSYPRRYDYYSDGGGSNRTGYTSFITGFHQGRRFNHDGESYIVVGPAESWHDNSVYNVMHTYECYESDWEINFGAYFVQERAPFKNQVYVGGILRPYENKSSELVDRLNSNVSGAVLWIYNSKSKHLPYATMYNKDTRPYHTNYDCNPIEFIETKEAFMVLEIPYNEDYDECTDGECYDPDPDDPDPPDDPDELVCNDLVATKNDYSYFDLFDCYVEKMKTTALFSALDDLVEVPDGGNSKFSMDTENYGNQEIDLQLFSNGLAAFKGCLLIIASYLSCKIITISKDDA